MGPRFDAIFSLCHIGINLATLRIDVNICRNLHKQNREQIENKISKIPWVSHAVKFEVRINENFNIIINTLDVSTQSTEYQSVYVRLSFGSLSFDSMVLWWDKSSSSIIGYRSHPQCDIQNKRIAGNLSIQIGFVTTQHSFSSLGAPLNALYIHRCIVDIADGTRPHSKMSNHLKLYWTHCWSLLSIFHSTLTWTNLSRSDSFRHTRVLSSLGSDDSHASHQRRKFVNKRIHRQKKSTVRCRRSNRNGVIRDKLGEKTYESNSTKFRFIYPFPLFYFGLTYFHLCFVFQVHSRHSIE